MPDCGACDIAETIGGLPPNCANCPACEDDERDPLGLGQMDADEIAEAIGLD